MVYFYKPKKLIFLGFFLFSFTSSFILGAQETPNKPSFNSQWDWHLGVSYSPFYTGMHKNIWDTVEYLAILQRAGSSKTISESSATGILGGFGWVFYNQNKVRISFGGEYALSYFRTKGIYTFGEDGGFSYVPPEGSQQKVLMEGLDHKVSPYLKVSFAGSHFPIDLQLNVGVAFSHLVAMTLEDWNGKTHKVTALKPNKPVELIGEDISGNPVSYPLDFGLKNTFNLALTTGVKASFHALFVGFNYTTNIVQSSYEVQVGLNFKNNFFKDAWN